MPALDACAGLFCCALLSTTSHRQGSQPARTRERHLVRIQDVRCIAPLARKSRCVARRCATAMCLLAIVRPQSAASTNPALPQRVCQTHVRLRLYRRGHASRT